MLCTLSVSEFQTERVWRDEDIVDFIEEVGDSVALVLLSGQLMIMLCYSE